jgi:hypothetical protein
MQIHLHLVPITLANPKPCNLLLGSNIYENKGLAKVVGINRIAK